MPEITISDDGLQAIAASVGPRTTADEIIEALNEAGATHGMDSGAIVAAINEAKKSGNPVSDVVVAKGTPPRFKVPPELIHKPRGTEEKLPSLSSFNQLLQVERPEDVLKAAKGVEILAVAEGDLLAVRVEGEIEPGKSVRDQVIDTIGKDQEPPQFTPGMGVAVQSSEFKAKYAGYVGMLDGQVTVLPPVWVSPDDMVAAYVNVKKLPGSADFTSKEVSSALSAAGVKVGIVEERLAALGKSLEQGTLKKVLVPMAAGKFPKKPENAGAEFTFAYESQSGAVHKDGSIDLREREGFPSVAEGDLLASSTPSVSAVLGSTVKGREIDVEGPMLVELVAGENVRLEGEGETQKIFSEITGGVSVQKTEQTTDEGTTVQYTVSAREVAQIAGNVDYETGNIDYKGNIEIKGTVVSGFSVKATGDVVIMESVENAVEIEADGDVTVKQGIVGEDTRVTTKGGVQAKFIQDATIVAGGDVVVDSYIRTAHIQTETEVNVTGGGASGGIMGGETWALKSIVSKNIGAEGTVATLVSVGVLPSLFDEYKTKRAEAEKANTSKLELMKSLGIKELTPETIEQIVAKNPNRKDDIMRFLKLASDAAATEKACRDEMTALAEKMEGHAKTAHIDVTSTAFHKIRVRIGDAETVLNDNLSGVRFRLNKGDDEEGVGWGSLTESDKESE